MKKDYKKELSEKLNKILTDTKLSDKVIKKTKKIIEEIKQFDGIDILNINAMSDGTIEIDFNNSDHSKYVIVYVLKSRYNLSCHYDINGDNWKTSSETHHCSKLSEVVDVFKNFIL